MKKVTGSRFQVTAKRSLFALLALFIFLYLIPSTLYSVRAEVEIGKVFGFGGITTLGEMTSKLVNPVFSLAAAAVIIYFLWGAFKYLISKGEKEEIAAARAIIIHAIIGFIILMFAFLILQFLLSSLFGITGFQIFQS